MAGLGSRAESRLRLPRRLIDFMKYGKAVTGFGIAVVLAVLRFPVKPLALTGRLILQVVPRLMCSSVSL